MLKPLPIGIQTFRDIIEGGYLYVDKTELLFPLINHAKGIYFLSRPRRFGKSLLLSTLKEIFSGNKEFFQGLWLYNSAYQWKKFPIIRIDFSRQKAENEEQLKQFIRHELDYIAAEYGVTLTQAQYFERFRELLSALKNHGKIVILIDEYDKPIIDHITDIPVANAMREVLKGFYSVIKSMDEYLRFVLLTGVSKFSKAGVFSGLNQLNDISMNNAFSAMLGITDEELNRFFDPYLAAMTDEKTTKNEILKNIRLWYNGYCFSGAGSYVYNPFSTLLFFNNKEFKNYWFETGTPSFLMKLIREKNFEMASIPILVDERMFSTYEPEFLQVLPLLYQTGYLTLKEYHPDTMLYLLDYPNYEVKNSFLSHIIDHFSYHVLNQSVLYRMIEALRKNALDDFFLLLNSFFAEIPYDIHIPNEKYYQTIFHSLFTLIGLKTQAEVKTNIGRIDAVINDQSIFVFEFKFNASKEKALQQILEKKYHEKYMSHGKPVYLVGVEFSEKNVKDWVVQKATSE